jgi:hypothetical protein
MSIQVDSRVPVRDLVAKACRAPSVHNSQPWRWVVDGDRVTLFADRSRQLVYADPTARDLVLSCGAALHHLKVAAAAAGWTARIRRMPNPENDAQLASVTFAPGPVVVEAVTEADALARRRTDRRNPSSRPVTHEHLDPLLQVVGRAGAVAYGIVSARARFMVRELLASADAVQRRDPRYLTEITGWAGGSDDEGIPLANLLDHAPAVGHRSAASRFPSGHLRDGHPGEEARGAFIAICTSSDDDASRLRAGEALSALLLRGTVAGLAMVPLSQAIEVDHTRRVLQEELLHDTACPQILVRVGWPADDVEDVPITGRRAASAVVCRPSELPGFLGDYC